MVEGRLDLGRNARAVTAAVVAVLTLAAGSAACAQELVPPGLPDPRPITPSAELPPPGLPGYEQAEPVVDVRVEGHRNVKLQKITKHIRTRAGRPFDPEMVEEDVRRLTKSRLFISVDTSFQREPGGLVIIFHVVERPTLHYVKYVGNTVRKSRLEKETGLTPGEALDPYAIEEARRKLEEYYLSKGFSKATVKTIEGSQPTDRGAVFLINEGRKQKIFYTKFVGNTIATDARLRTQIQSKPPFLYLFKGEVDRQKIEGDIERLTAYYRSLGFFSAKIGRELVFNEKQNWLTLTFVIDEGPRYVVRNLACIGHTRFQTGELMANLKLEAGEHFNESSMKRDAISMQDKYGAKGYVFAAVQPDIRFNEKPGELDLVYQIEEGRRCRVGRIDVTIEGENPRTRRNTVLNRISLHPGDLLDIRKLRDSERRLKASGLFLVDPAQGIEPKIVFRQPELDDEEALVDRPAPGHGFRGQSPDSLPPQWRPNRPAAQPPDDVGLIVEVQGQLLPDGGEPPPNAALANAPRPAAFRAVPRLARLPIVRGQSPDDEPLSPYARQPAPTSHADSNRPQKPARLPPTGQVPMGRTNPDAPLSPRYRNPVAPAGSPAVVPAQYTDAPAPAGTGSDPYAPGGPFGPSPAPRQGGSVTGPISGPAGVSPVPNGYSDADELFPQDSPFIDPGEEPPLDINLNTRVTETQTGRFMFGVGVNSNAGLVGNVVIDEQNFDWRRFPRSWEEVRNGAFRGGGQQFRIEAVPGNQVERYMFTFRDPYWFDTRVSFGLSGYFFNRRYRDWDEERLGGRPSLGYQFTPDLSGTLALRMENVEIVSRRAFNPPELARVLGDNGLYSARLSLAHDTRDSTFLATQGHYVEVGLEQAFGDFDFSRATIEARQHFLLGERPDGSGRHVLTLGTDLGFTGSDTPVFEHFFAGGFSTLRGFRFREASPRSFDVLVGGRFQWLNTVEYMFPITADDALRGVLFTDFGTVERDVELNSANYRVSPGFGLRITIPALGPAPIALDFAFPIARADGDRIQNFSFFVGFTR